MKERYIRAVERALRGDRKAKSEILRDLEEAFASAAEHGETEQALIARLGPPEEFARSAEGRTDMPASAKGRSYRPAAAALVLALICFAAYGLARAQQPPEGSIGYAVAMTGIQLAGGVDFVRLIFQVGMISLAVAAVIAIKRRMRRRKES